MITKQTFDFLKALKKNNNRDWFNLNKNRYLTTYEEIGNFVELLLLELGKIDPGIEGLNAKECIFRIYKDIRFSKDKTPYKTNLGAWIVKGGKKSEQASAGYYVHIEPGKSFLGGGAYHMPTDKLTMIRKEIFNDTKNFKKIIMNKDFKKYYPELWGEKIVKAPKGFPKDFANIELLKYKNYVYSHKLTDEIVLSKDFLRYTVKAFRVLYPFTKFLNKSLD